MRAPNAMLVRRAACYLSLHICRIARILSMKHLLKKGSILILLGTGGVGKTTVAAALGLAAAQRLRSIPR